jgi:hypothetical protein
MQFIAIMKIRAETTKDKLMSLNVAETVKCWDMVKSDILRALWFLPGEPMPSGTVALMECTDQKEAESQCNELPFIAHGVASLELLPLKPCTAYELLFDSKHKP